MPVPLLSPEISLVDVDAVVDERELPYVPLPGEGEVPFQDFVKLVAAGAASGAFADVDDELAVRLGGEAAEDFRGVRFPVVGPGPQHILAAVHPDGLLAGAAQDFLRGGPVPAALTLRVRVSGANFESEPVALPGEVSGGCAHFEYRRSAGFCGDPPDVVRGDHGETEAGDVGAATDAVQDVVAVVDGVFAAAGRFHSALAHGVEERCAQGFVGVFGRVQRVLQDLVRRLLQPPHLTVQFGSEADACEAHGEAPARVLNPAWVFGFVVAR